MRTRHWCLVALLLAPACSGNDNGGDRAAGDTSSTTAASPTTTPMAAITSTTAPARARLQEYDVPAGSHPHDVAVADDGTVWYTAQAAGKLGRLDPRSGRVTEVALGDGSRPHGVIIGPDGSPWITDSGMNAIVRVDAASLAVRIWPLPSSRDNANLNTAVFDGRGTLWFTGQAGVYGRLAPSTNRVEVFDAPRGRGPYGITATPSGDVYYASLAGNHVARVDTKTGAATVLEPPTARQGTRRVWSDSRGRIWCSQWNAGQVAVYDPATSRWQEWKLPGDRPQAYAVYVDDRDVVWLSDFAANAFVQFNPTTETFVMLRLPTPSAAVRQIHGRAGTVWGAESAADKLVAIDTAP